MSRSFCSSCKTLTADDGYCDGCFFDAIKGSNNKQIDQATQSSPSTSDSSQDSIDPYYQCPIQSCCHRFLRNASIRRHLIVKHGIDRYGRAVSKKDIERERSYLYHRKKNEAPISSHKSVGRSKMTNLRSRTSKTMSKPYPKSLKMVLKELWDDYDDLSDNQKMAKTREIIDNYWSNKTRFQYGSEDEAVAAKCQKLVNDYYSDDSDE